MPSVPFTAEAFEGFAEIHGLVRYDGGPHLDVEFQTQDALFGMLKSSPKVLSLAMSDIAEVEFKPRRWRKSRLTIRVSSLTLLDGMPGNKGTEIRLFVKREHNETMYRLLEDLEAAIRQDARLEGDGAPEPPPLPA